MSNGKSLRSIEAWQLWRHVNDEDNTGTQRTSLAPQKFPFRDSGHIHFFDADYVSASKALAPGANDVLDFSNYTFVPGDQVVFTNDGTSSTPLPKYRGFEIATKTGDSLITLVTDPFGGNVNDLQCHVMPVRQYITANPFGAVAIRMFGWHGTDPADKTASIRIIGFMGPDNESLGPGQVLWDGTITCGDSEVGLTPAKGVPTKASTWNEVDTYTPTSGACSALAQAYGDVDSQMVLVLPVLFYHTLLMEITDLGDTGELAELAVVYCKMPGDILISS